MQRILRLLVPILLILAIVSQGHAEIITIEVMIKSVDANNRTITATRKGKTLELDVSKNAPVSINGKAEELSTLSAGQTAKIDFETNLEIVTKVQASGEAEPDPELLVLREINTEHTESTPWVSPDGLTIYWTVKTPSERNKWIWTARRRDVNSLFENKQRLLPGSDPTVSSSGLEMILLQDNMLHRATRDALDQPFQRPKKLDEFGDKYGFLAAPCLSGDGLMLYFDWFIQGKSVMLSSASRKTLGSKWGPPRPLGLNGLEKSRVPSVSSDGKNLVCQTPTEGDGSNIAVFQRASVEDNFVLQGMVDCGDIIARGMFPRYVPATSELFYAAPTKEGGDMEIMVIKNFSPATMIRRTN